MSPKKGKKKESRKQDCGVVLPPFICQTKAVILSLWSPDNLPDFSYHPTQKHSGEQNILKYHSQNSMVELSLDFTTYS